MATNGRVSRPRGVLSRNGSAMPYQRPDTGLVHPPGLTEQAKPEEACMGKLEGKIALITGGNSGIGLAAAKQFANEGAYVFITGRRDPELAGAAQEIGRHVTGVQGDVSNLGVMSPFQIDTRANAPQTKHRKLAPLVGSNFLGNSLVKSGCRLD